MRCDNFLNEYFKEALNNLISSMVRQAHHERNQHPAVRPMPVEGLKQSFLKNNSGFLFCLSAFI
jgi:hypothetical protein